MKHNKSITILLIALTIVTLISSCKRGEDDPFFSLLSRKTRVTGDWRIDYFESQLFQKFQNSYKANRKFVIEGDRITLTVDSIDTPHDTTITIYGVLKESEYNFDKNSKMKFLLNYELVIEKISVDENTNITTYDKKVQTFTDRANGTWNFLGSVEKNGVNKYKDKERISFIYESYNTDVLTVHTIRKVNEEGVTISNTYTSSRVTNERKFANGENAQIWELRELRNKKIVAERLVDNLIQNTFISNDSVSIGQSYTEKGYELMRLLPKQ
jgi:hypothetical protein